MFNFIRQLDKYVANEYQITRMNIKETVTVRLLNKFNVLFMPTTVVDKYAFFKVVNS